MFKLFMHTVLWGGAQGRVGGPAALSCFFSKFLGRKISNRNDQGCYASWRLFSSMPLVFKAIRGARSPYTVKKANLHSFYLVLML